MRMGFFAYIDRVLKHGALFLIFIYQKTISPDTGIARSIFSGTICSHEPHCSEYVKECFEKYGFFKGIGYGMNRVVACGPSREKVYDPSSYRVVFFSGASIGVPFLEKIIQDNRFDLVGVVSQPSVPSGRGMKTQDNVIVKSLKQFQELHDELQSVEIATPPSLKRTSKLYSSQASEFHDWLIGLQPDLLIVVAYGKIIPQSVLDIADFGAVNVHGSLLPEYRGASPLQSVFLDKKDETGITIMKMNAQLDEGDILSLHTIPLSINDTVDDLIQQIQHNGPNRMVNSIWEWLKKEIDPVPQDDTLSSYCSKIEKSDGLIDPFTESLEDCMSKIRAYALRPKTFFVWKDKRIVVESVLVDSDSYQLNKKLPMVTNNDGTYVINPSIVTFLLKPEGKKSISWDEFVRGYVKN